MSKLQAALAWTARGFRCFPLHANSKEPLFKGWPELATTDHDQIRRWWQNPVFGENDYNIGCVPDGLVVDPDVKDGKNGLSNFLGIGGAFDTLTVRTPTGGFHLYYAAPATANSAGRLIKDVDTRGPRGFVVAPGSEIDGKPYVLVLDEPIAPAPAAFLSKLLAPRERDVNQEWLVDEDTPQALALGRLWLSDHSGATEGGRHDHTYATAAYLRDLGVSETTAGELMLEEWAERPLDEEETIDCVRDAYTYAQNAPGSKHPAASFEGFVPAPIDVEAELFAFFGSPPMLAEMSHPSHGTPAAPDGSNPFEQFGNTPDMADIEPFPWLVSGWLMRKDTTVLAAHGGVGKSLVSLKIAISLAAGLNTVLGRKNAHAGVPQKIIIYNAEDRRDVMAMRLYAQCEVLGVNPAIAIPNIVLVSGRDFELLLMEGDRDPEVTDKCKRGMEMLINAAIRHSAALIVLDPLAKLHHVNENDNGTMSRLIGNINRIAELTNTAILLLHHKAKGNKTGQGRGAGAIEDSVRFALSMSTPDEEEAIKLGLTAAQAREFIGLYDGKMNHALASEKVTWLRKRGVHLANGETVGALVLAETDDAAGDNGRRMADALDMAMRTSGTATLQVGQAVTVIHAADPLLDKLSSGVSELRMKAMLERGLIVATNGTKFCLLVDGGKRFVAIDVGAPREGFG